MTCAPVVLAMVQVLASWCYKIFLVTEYITNKRVSFVFNILSIGNKNWNGSQFAMRFLTVIVLSHSKKMTNLHNCSNIIRSTNTSEKTGCYNEFFNIIIARESRLQ
jgi:hypothetical protein